jgi:hypothetical protein
MCKRVSYSIVKTDSSYVGYTVLMCDYCSDSWSSRNVCPSICPKLTFLVSWTDQSHNAAELDVCYWSNCYTMGYMNKKECVLILNVIEV